MTTKNICEFLQGFSAQELKEHGILKGTSHLLMGASVDPLITFMQEHGVERLEYPDSNWFLDVHRDFRNPGSEELKEGNVANLSVRGSVFSYTNTTITHTTNDRTKSRRLEKKPRKSASDLNVIYRMLFDGT